MGGYNHPPQQQPPPPPHKESSDGHPHMLSFKAWLSTQDDQISDQDALSKYADYKKEFKRQQLNEFFVAHREEEWFRNKYHPDDSTKRKEEQFHNLKTRVSTFVEFMETGRFQGVTLDATQSEKIIKLMDWYVIRLEGGSNEDAAKLLSEEAIMKPRPALLPKPDEKTKEAEVKKVEPPVNKEIFREESEASLSGSDSEDDKNSEDEGRIRKRKKEKKVSTSAVEALEAALETNNGVKSDDERDDANVDEDASNDATKKRGKKRSRDSDKGSDLSDIEDENDKDKKSDEEMEDDDEEGEDGGKKEKREEKQK
jgi:hypothetical protein